MSYYAQLPVPVEHFHHTTDRSYPSPPVIVQEPVKEFVRSPLLAVQFIGAAYEASKGHHLHSRWRRRREAPFLFQGLLSAIAFLFQISFPYALSASPSSTTINQAAGIWNQVVAEGSLSEIDGNLSDVRLWLESQTRFNNANPMSNMNWYQEQARVALGYAMTDRMNFWVGYTYLATQNYGKSYVGEQDIWPAVRYVIPSRLGTVMLREMVEVRYVRGDAPGIRPRTMAKLLHPLDFEPRLAIVLWDEIFFNLNNVQNNPLYGLSGFNQNRAFAGMSWSFNKNTRLEFGYMNQFINRTDPRSPHTSFGSLNVISAGLYLGW